MLWDDLESKLTSDGTAFLEYTEGATKTKQGILHDQRHFMPKLFEHKGSVFPSNIVRRNDLTIYSIYKLLTIFIMSWWTLLVINYTKRAAMRRNQVFNDSTKY